MNGRGIVAVAVGAAIAMWASAAAAVVVVSIGVSSTSTPPGVAGSSAIAPSSAFLDGTAGGIEFITTGTGNPPLPDPGLLSAVSVDIAASSGGGHGFVFITAQGITSPVGALSFLSAFTSQPMPVGWTATSTTYFNAGDTLFGTSTLLNTAVFTGLGTGVILANQVGAKAVSGVAGSYSVTAVLEIFASVGGRSSHDIEISAVPGPIVGAGLPGFLLAACGGLLVLARRRRRMTAIAA